MNLDREIRLPLYIELAGKVNEDWRRNLEHFGKEYELEYEDTIENFDDLASVEFDNTQIKLNLNISVKSLASTCGLCEDEQLSKKEIVEDSLVLYDEMELELRALLKTVQNLKKGLIV